MHDVTGRPAAPARPGAPTGEKPKAKLPVDKGAPGNEKLDQGGNAMDVQNVASDWTRYMVTAEKASDGVKTAGAIIAGDRTEISDAVKRTLARTEKAAKAHAPKQAEKIMKVATPTVEGAGTLLRWFGKAAPFISLPFAGYDVYKAYKEGDASKKAGAWTNAALSVAGTGMGLAALVAAPAAVAPLLAGAVGLGAFQLVDSVFMDGKAQDVLGGMIKGGWTKLKSLFS